MDYNSTAPVLPFVLHKVLDVMKAPCNPSSQHFYGQYARRIVEEARSLVKQSVGADEGYELIFTSGGTEANNIVMNSGDSYLVSAAVHLSVLNSAKKHKIVPVDENGLLDLEILEEMLQNECGNSAILSVIYANNETGVIQDIEPLVKIAHKYGVTLHADAVQAYGKIAIDIKSLNVDIMTISAHKVGGPVGVGALIFKKNIKIIPLFFGGSQERGYRSGTENVAAIAGFGVLSFNIQQSIDSMQNVLLLRDLFEEQLSSTIYDVIICGNNVRRLPNTSLVITPNVLNELQVIYFDMHGIAISAGSACSSGKVDASHVLCAMGFSKALAKCAVRVSLGRDNNEDDVNFLVNLWKLLYNKSA